MLKLPWRGNISPAMNDWVSLISHLGTPEPEMWPGWPRTSGAEGVRPSCRAEPPSAREEIWGGEKCWRDVSECGDPPGQGLRRTRARPGPRDVMIISDVRGEGLEVSRDVETVGRLRGRGCRDSFVIGVFLDLTEKIRFQRESSAFRWGSFQDGVWHISPQCSHHWLPGSYHLSPSWLVAVNCRKSSPALSLSLDSSLDSWPGSSWPDPGWWVPRSPPPPGTWNITTDTLESSLINIQPHLSSLAARLFGSGDFFLLKSLAETASRLLWPGRYLALLLQNLHLRTFLMAPMLPVLSTSSELDGFWKNGVVGQYYSEANISILSILCIAIYLSI